jgi:alkaline phosphatase D
MCTSCWHRVQVTQFWWLLLCSLQNCATPPNTARPSQHQTPDNAYTEGATDHDTATQGELAARQHAGLRAWFEWTPTRFIGGTAAAPRFYRSFEWGSLVSLLMLDTRYDGRTEQIAAANNAAGAIMSSAQLGWIATELQKDVSTWKVLGNQVAFTPLFTFANNDAWQGERGASYC